MRCRYLFHECLAASCKINSYTHYSQFQSFGEASRLFCDIGRNLRKIPNHSSFFLSQ